MNRRLDAVIGSAATEIALHRPKNLTVSRLGMLRIAEPPRSGSVRFGNTRTGPRPTRSRPVAARAACRSRASPSIVVILPFASEIGIWQERMARPSISTVHAPHAPIPQPYLAPFRSSVSRSTQSNGVSPAASTVRGFRLILSWNGIRCHLKSMEKEGTLRYGAKESDRRITRPRHFAPKSLRMYTVISYRQWVSLNTGQP